MDNEPVTTIPLETALEYHAFAAERGRRAGEIGERQRIFSILKEKQMHQALAVLIATQNNK